jgi:hypothetical protein
MKKVSRFSIPDEDISSLSGAEYKLIVLATKR